MTDPDLKCPECGSGAIAAVCRVWVEFQDDGNIERRVDPEDLDYAEPIPGTSRVCRHCTHEWQDQTEQVAP